MDNYEQEFARIEVKLRNAGEAVLRDGGSDTLTKLIQEREKRKRWLEYQLRQLNGSEQDKVYQKRSRS